MNDPTVLAQRALELAQLFAPDVHSLTSVHVLPDAEYPELHEHVKLPAVFVHTCWGSVHVSISSTHSLMSEQLS